MISNPTPTIPILYKYKFLLNYRLTKGNGGIKHASLIVRKTMQTERQCNTGSWATVQTFLFGVGIFPTFFWNSIWKSSPSGIDRYKNGCENRRFIRNFRVSMAEVFREVLFHNLNWSASEWRIRKIIWLGISDIFKHPFQGLDVFRLTKLSVSHLDVKFRRFKNRKYCLDIFPHFQFSSGRDLAQETWLEIFPFGRTKIHKLFKEVTQCLGVRFYPIQIYGAISKRQAPRTRPVLDGRVQYLS